MNRFKMFMCGIAATVVAIIILIVVILIIYAPRMDVILSILALVWVINFIFVVYILGSDRHINTKACWCTAIALLWTVGCLLFLIFGTNPLRKIKWRQRIQAQRIFNKHEDYSYTNTLLNANDDENNLFKYSYFVADKPVYQNNEITILKSNTDTYKQVIDLIRSAKNFIHFETYLIRDGFFLRTVFCELIQRARAGIKVRLLYDWYGALGKFKKKQIRELEDAGIEVGVFNFPGKNIFKSATNFRLHNKSLIIDNRVALYGGSNVGNEYLAMDPNKYYWRDMNMIIKGELVNSLNINFINGWIYFTNNSVSKLKKDELTKDLNKWLSIDHSFNQHPLKAQLSLSPPNYPEKGVSDTMIMLFSIAKKTIKIVTPYFLPTESVSESLKLAAMNNIDIQIILPGKRDNKDFIIPMNRSQYPDFMDRNVKIHEYNGFIHSKYIIVDDKYVYTTSANFDFRSLIINFENGILFDSPKICNEMLAIFQDDLANSRLVTIEDLVKYNTLRSKLRIKLLNLYKPLI